MAVGHGANPAAWTTVAIVIVAFLVGAIGLVWGPNWVVFWIGVALIPVGALVGKVMVAMGLGDTGHRA
jgi:hypothetical protein